MQPNHGRSGSAGPFGGWPESPLGCPGTVLSRRALAPTAAQRARSRSGSPRGSVAKAWGGGGWVGEPRQPCWEQPGAGWGGGGCYQPRLATKHRGLPL